MNPLDQTNNEVEGESLARPAEADDEVEGHMIPSGRSSADARSGLGPHDPK